MLLLLLLVLLTFVIKLLPIKIAHSFDYRKNQQNPTTTTKKKKQKLKNKTNKKCLAFRRSNNIATQALLTTINHS